jgi:hypothetical protein
MDHDDYEPPIEALSTIEPPEPDLPDETIIELANTIDQRVRAIDRILGAVVKLAGQGGIDDLGGKPYFNDGGCKRIAAGTGIWWETPTERRVNLDGGHYEYQFDGIFHIGSRECPATGSASSKKPFYSRSKDRDGNPVDVNPQDIDQGNVRKHALTNLINNGIKGCLGLKNLSWEDLKNIGLEPAQAAAKVTYGTAPLPTDAKDRLDACKNMLRDLSNGDKVEGANILQRLTAFTPENGKPFPGYRDITKVKEKMLMNNHENGFFNRLTAEWEESNRAMVEGAPLSEDEAAKMFGGEVE